MINFPIKAIVTGGTGFIGSNVADRLKSKGHEVLVIDDLSGSGKENLPEGCKFSQVSINDDVISLFMDFQPDVVYHLAAYAAEGLSHHIPAFNYTNNISGTVNILNAAYAAGAKHFVFTSSIAAYGHPEEGVIFNEESVCHPCDPYGIAKLACEYHIKAFHEYYGKMNYTIFRPHNVFGPKQNISDPYRNVVGIFMAKAMQNLPMPVFGNGEQTRSFSYIDVVAESIAMAPFLDAARNETFNIGGDELMSVKDLALCISDIFGRETEIDWLPARKEVVHAHCVHDKAREVFTAAYDEYALTIKEGLRRMADFVNAHPIPPVTECPAAIEILENLPPSWLKRLTQERGQ